MVIAKKGNRRREDVEPRGPLPVHCRRKCKTASPRRKAIRRVLEKLKTGAQRASRPLRRACIQKGRVTAGLCATARAWQQPQRPRQVDGGGGSGYGQDALRSGERKGNPAVRGDMDGARGQYAEMSRTEEDEGRVTHL